MAKKKGKGNNKLAVASLVLVTVAVLIMLFWPDVDTVSIACALIGLCGVAAVVCGEVGKSQIKKSKEEGKGMATAGLIIGIIMAILGLMIVFMFEAIKDISFNDQVYCKQVTNCVDNGNGTSTCLFMDELEMPCTTEYLTETQFKK